MRISLDVNKKEGGQIREVKKIYVKTTVEFGGYGDRSRGKSFLLRRRTK